jgi:hypothetical protein
MFSCCEEDVRDQFERLPRGKSGGRASLFISLFFCIRRIHDIRLHDSLPSLAAATSHPGRALVIGARDATDSGCLRPKYTPLCWQTKGRHRDISISLFAWPSKSLLCELLIDPSLHGSTDKGWHHAGSHKGSRYRLGSGLDF